MVSRIIPNVFHFLDDEYSVCKTSGGKTTDKPCVFPFWSKETGLKYEKCTMDIHTVPWCATEVDAYGFATDWGNCNLGCSVEGVREPGESHY